MLKLRYYIVMLKKSGLLIILLLLFVTIPCSAKSLKVGKMDSDIPKVFVYHIPEDTQELTGVKPSTLENSELVRKDIVSDDITADTSGEETDEENEITENEEIVEFGEDYQITDMYSDVLHGYAAYEEDEEDVISLEDTLEVYQAIKIKKPAKVGTTKYAHGVYTPSNIYSSLNTVEYSIAPISGKSYAKKSGFTLGTMYDQGIDYAELEQSTGVFSRYETKYFAISTAYAKTVNTTNNNYNDNFYLAPELILNQYFSLKEVLSTDITKNRKKFETVLSINPFGKRDIDRLRFELGASSTYDDKNALLKNQFKFSTKFKL